MRISGVFLGLWFASLVGAVGQVTVELVLDQQQFLPGESVPVAVRIVNRSGQTLHLGNDDEWLSVAIQGRGGAPVAQTADLPVRGEFTLETSERATRRLDLAPCFNLSQKGNYLIQAVVKIAQWDKAFASDPVLISVISGAKLWDREFGVPQADTRSLPEVRKYSLQQANYLKKHLRLYLRVTDVTESKIFRVLALGPMVSFGQPEPQLDAQSNLHVLYQHGRTLFSYVVVNPDGDVLIRQTYEVAATRPRLKLSEDGKIVVGGGVRRFAKDDFPPPPPVEAAPPLTPAPLSTDAAAVTNEAKVVNPPPTQTPPTATKKKKTGAKP